MAKGKNGGRIGVAADKHAKDRMAALLDGRITVQDLTMAELMKGRIANSDGTFSAGLKPRLPTSILHGMTNEIARRAMERIRRYGDEAVQGLMELANEAESEQVRLQSWKLIAEYALGKPQERVIISSADPWQDIIDGIMAEERGGVGGDNSEPTGRKGSTPRGASPHT